MLEELLIFTKISLQENIAHQDEECSLYPRILMAEKVFFDKFGDLEFTVNAIDDAILCYSANGFGFQVEVLKCVL